MKKKCFSYNIFRTLVWIQIRVKNQSMAAVKIKEELCTSYPTRFWHEKCHPWHLSTQRLFHVFLETEANMCLLAVRSVKRDFKTRIRILIVFFCKISGCFWRRQNSFQFLTVLVVVT